MTDTPARPDPLAVMRSRPYLGLLLLAAALGAPVAVVAYYFLKLTVLLQHWLFTDLPTALGFATEPTWWPLVPLAVAGVAVGLVIPLLPRGWGGGGGVGVCAAGGARP